MDQKIWNAKKEKHSRWWQHRGTVLSRWAPFVEAHAAPDIEGSSTCDEKWTDPDKIAQRIRAEAPRTLFPADMAPIADFVGWGPGCLALYLGARPKFSEDTVWFFPREDDVEGWPSFRFDPANGWWRLHETTLRRLVDESNGEYLIGCPDLVENLDVLASLRGSEQALFDLVERPEWVAQKIEEINRVWFEAYTRIWRIIRAADGSCAYQAYGLWGEGKTAKLQCDISAMISDDMFDRLVVPALTRQAGWLDHSVYHLDGTQALHHLDSICAIPHLEAVEWTPQAGIEGGGDPRWYSMYRKILDSGKSVMTVHVSARDVIPLLDAVGPDGIFLHIQELQSPEELEAIAEEVGKHFPEVNTESWTTTR